MDSDALSSNNSKGIYAKDSLHHLQIIEVEFSGPTYQIEVFDGDLQKSFWPLIHLKEDHSIQDAFCSCNTPDNCKHLKSAIDFIFRKGEALHLRFEHSFWSILLQSMAEALGYEQSPLKKVGKHKYQIQEEGYYVSIEALDSSGLDFIQKYIVKRVPPNEENSLKFSNLSQEEIMHWKEGRPSQKVRYILSFWYDIAQWQMLAQERGERYKITFSEDKEHLPTHIDIVWRELSLHFELRKKELIQLIPTLEGVKASLKLLFSEEHEIKSIHYEAASHALLIQRDLHSSASKRDLRTIGVDGWLYLPQEGFIRERSASLFNNAPITGAQIGHFLDHLTSSLKELMEGVKVSAELVPASYSLSFDKEWNWHFEPYLFTPGDLRHPLSAIYGEWAYLHPQKTFYRIENGLFPEQLELVAIVSRAQVSAFIDIHRVWLNEQPGFATHLVGRDSQVEYRLTSQALEFFAVGALGEEKSHDFGQWIYYAQQGFFLKQRSGMRAEIHPGISVPLEEIASFIALHQSELESLRGFFTSHCPYLHRGVEISLTPDKKLFVKPSSLPLPDYRERVLRLFGKYVYISGEGFYPLPSSMQIPDTYAQPLIVDQNHLSAFFRTDFPALKPYILFLDPRITLPQTFALEIHDLSKPSPGNVKVKLFYKTEIGLIPVSELREAMAQHKQWLFTEGGLIELNEARFNWIHNIKRSAYLETQEIELSIVEFLKLDTYEQTINKIQDPKKQALVHSLRNLVPTDIPQIKELKSTLRPYQKSGLLWLWFLYQNGLSGILCDEMGLGKTHQAMALLAAIHALKTRSAQRFLIVCPTSVIYHWQEKLARFLPKLKVFTFHGANRTLKRLPKKGAILTTYGICRTEKEKLSNIAFEAAIFDELQMAKNARSRIHQSLTKIQAKTRIGLTGTPIENNLGELKALFDIILPGYMPSESQFRLFFLGPIEKENSAERRALLRDLIHPFMLRRKKSEVLQELPEKSEEKCYCLLSQEQVALYQESLQRQAVPLLGELKEEHQSISYLHLFAILTKLKQICDHPSIYFQDPKSYLQHHSGKWELFKELIAEARSSDQKVVIFSQYLFMLDIIGMHLQAHGWSYAQIRGDTQDRQKELQTFQEDPNCLFFIGTLQAAGVGIDLTSASVVILYDRWWNAARENQAIDRVHRIGQKWGVQVYKLITKGTIEEKIDQLIEKKQGLLEDIVLAEDQEMIKSFTRQELIDLFSFSPYPKEEQWDLE